MKEHSEMISIVIITFNRSGLLKKTLQSVLNQNYKDFEIILVDDGSEDDTSEMVGSLNDNRIRYFNFGKIGNLSRLRNLGIKESEQKFIAFCDDDDLWEKDKLSEQLELMDNWDLVCSNAVVIDKNDDVIKNKYFDDIDKSFEITHDFLVGKGNCILTSSCLLKKELLVEFNLYFDEITFTNFCEDYELFIRISRHGKIFFQDKNLILKRSHDSVSGGLNNNIKMLVTSIAILEKFNLKNKDGSSDKLKTIEGILSYYFLLVKYSFRKSFKSGIIRLSGFIKYLFDPVVLNVFIKEKLFTKISKMLKSK